MAKLELSGISKLGGYLLSNRGPLDKRTVVPERSNLNDLATDYYIYPGIIVYAQLEDKHYKYTKDNTWEECIDSNKLTAAVKDALVDAKQSGDFKGDKGDKGDAFTYDNFTPGQLEALKGKDGADGKDGVDGAQGPEGPQGPAGPAGADGKDGTDGADGLTPYIGENGNWCIGTVDTGVKAAGEGGAEFTYTNNTPTVTDHGGIPKGTTFTNVPIHDVLTMILYPYIDIVVQNPVANAATGAYTIPNYPTLSSVSIYVKKNSATNLAFSLWDTTTNTQLGKTLGESDISGNQMTFADLNTVINTDRIFTIKYTYTGDDGKLVAEQEITVGSFSFTFNDPSAPTVSSNLKSTSYYNGQTAEVTSITADVANIHSASEYGITKMELYRGDSLVITSEENPGTSYTFNFAESDKITLDTTYTVKAYYKKRTAISTEYFNESVEKSYPLSFSRKAATVSFDGITGGNFSKLNPQSISSGSVTANFTKYSDSITSVKLLESGSAKEEKIVSGHDSTVYSETPGNTTFDYSKINTCTDFKLKAQVFNGTTAGESSSEISYSFYAPYCYGFVDQSVTFESVNRDVLAGLESSQTMTEYINKVSEGYKKFIYAIPYGNYTSAKDSAGNGDENFPLFENSSSNPETTTKNIKFADGSEVPYQILIFREATANSIDLYFR
jgi:hypothetical protein